MKKGEYVRRVVDWELAEHLRAMGAVVIEGPRACGKTTTAREFAQSEVLLDVDENARSAVQIDPMIILEGDTPRLIDEWQLEPKIWNHIRRTIDDRGLPGQFILTGSAQPTDDVTRHTGAGRISRLRMRPMSLWETGISTGEISVKAIMDRESVRSADSNVTVSEIAEQISRGGWPGFLKRSTTDARAANLAYLDEIRRVDINRVDGTNRDPEKVGRLLQAVARSVATTAGTATLMQDVSPTTPLSREAVSGYLNALRRLLIIEDQPAWSAHLRSRSTLRQAPKRHFVDPSLAVAALGATPERLLRDLKYLGFLFESLAVRDLRIYGQPLGARVFHYRDNTGLEADLILQMDDGRWAAFEVKLGHGAVDEAARKLLLLSDRVKSDENVCLAVIVATGYGYTREDGVAVIPIGSLGP